MNKSIQKAQTFAKSDPGDYLNLRTLKTSLENNITIQEYPICSFTDKRMVKYNLFGRGNETQTAKDSSILN